MLLLSDNDFLAIHDVDTRHQATSRADTATTHIIDMGAGSCRRTGLYANNGGSALAAVIVVIGEIHIIDNDSTEIGPEGYDKDILCIQQLAGLAARGVLSSLQVDDYLLLGTKVGSGAAVAPNIHGWEQIEMGIAGCALQFDNQILKARQVDTATKLPAHLSVLTGAESMGSLIVFAF